MSQAVTDQRSLTIAEQIEACWKQRERWQGISDALSVILAPYATNTTPHRTAHKPATPQKRYLTKDESRQLKSGRIPSVKRSEVKLSRRQRALWKQALITEASAKQRRLVSA